MRNADRLADRRECVKQSGSGGARGIGPVHPIFSLPLDALVLIGAWNLLAAEPRQALRDALRCPDLDWERGQAWAFQQAMGLVWYYKDTNPVMSRLGRTTLDRLLTGR